jgi:hypothetical protein
MRLLGLWNTQTSTVVGALADAACMGIEKPVYLSTIS